MSTPKRSRPTPLNQLLQHAENMLAHNEFDAAEALLRVIVQRDPRHASARSMLDSIQPVAEQNYDSGYANYAGTFSASEERNERASAFLTHEEVQRFARISR